MRSLKVIFGGANKVAIDWNASVEGLASVAQRAGVSLMTQLGTDKFLPSRGTEVSKILFSYGVFDLLGMQHVLNFGALKARSDMQRYDPPGAAPADRVAGIQSTLLVVQDNVAQVGVTVSNQAGQITREITSIES
jgi:hypothetical protein